MKQMAMTVQLADKTKIERFLSLLNIGLCVAIEQGAVSIRAAEDYLYSPYTMKQLQRLGISPNVIDVVHLGTGLEDVASIVPEKLEESLAEMKQVALEMLQVLPPNLSGNQWVQTTPAVTQHENAPNANATHTRTPKVYAVSSS